MNGLIKKYNLKRLELIDMVGIASMQIARYDKVGELPRGFDSIGELRQYHEMLLKQYEMYTEVFEDLLKYSST
ncbi:hypothetical protein V6R21_05850 [Limibacter armeniacum]|uniref:hypothetical protein n=1 Tax=Limibacter armeniacum TaxID=466084 RepID=UPI002FE5BD6E